MLKILSKIYLSILILGLSFNVKADQEFDPTKVSIESENCIREIVGQLDPRGRIYSKNFNIYPSESKYVFGLNNLVGSNYKRFAPLSFSRDGIYVDEKIFNKLSLDEKRYLIFRDIITKRLIKNQNLKIPELSLSGNIPTALLVFFFIFATPIFVLVVILESLKRNSEYSEYYNKVKEYDNRFKEETLKQLSIHDSSAGAILYLDRVLKWVKEGKITGIDADDIIREIEKIEDLKQ